MTALVTLPVTGHEPCVTHPDRWDALDGSVDAAIAQVGCESCPIREACLRYALETQQPAGIWGGMTATQREAVLRTRRAA